MLHWGEGRTVLNAFVCISPHSQPRHRHHSILFLTEHDTDHDLLSLFFIPCGSSLGVCGAELHADPCSLLPPGLLFLLMFELSG